MGIPVRKGISTPRFLHGLDGVPSAYTLPGTSARKGGVPMAVPRSRKQERERLARWMRAQGKSWVEIAAILQQQFSANPRLAFRWAHVWSQQEVADQWNQCWPDELKTFKSISYWERWPGETGHAPSFDNLAKLAAVYECSVGDLLTDLPDYRDKDAAPQEAALVQSGLTPQSADLLVSLLGDGDAAGGVSPFMVLADPVGLTERLQAVTFDDLAQVVMMWLQEPMSSVSRRHLLAKLSSALAVAAVAPLSGALAGQPIQTARVLDDSSEFDEATLHYLADMVHTLRRQGDVLGPQLTLQTVGGLRHIARGLAKTAPPGSRQQAVSTYAELTQLTGWLCFNMGDYRSAEHYYDEARSAAHNAENIELATYVLCTMSHLATWGGRPRVGLDHAVAAAAWAQRVSPLAQAYAADVAVRAYVADNQARQCRQTLDREYKLLTGAEQDASTPSWWYFYDESFYWSTQAQCWLALHEPDAALDALNRSLSLLDPANLHEYTFRQLFIAEARIQQGEIDQAASIIAVAVRQSAVNSAERITQSLGRLRQLLAPWEGTAAVRDLDAQLVTYRPGVATGSGRT
jgi:tetratricopeptide (TPR) repeat protein